MQISCRLEGLEIVIQTSSLTRLVRFHKIGLRLCRRNFKFIKLCIQCICGPTIFSFQSWFTAIGVHVCMGLFVISAFQPSKYCCFGAEPQQLRFMESLHAVLTKMFYIPSTQYLTGSFFGQRFPTCVNERSKK